MDKLKAAVQDNGLGANTLEQVPMGLLSEITAEDRFELDATRLTLQNASCLPIGPDGTCEAPAE
jgi:hypothetical protein